MIIYKITNDINNKVYIGQTIRTLQERWNEHLKAKDKFKLHAAMSYYGNEHFHIEQIDSAQNIQELNEKEIYWINYYNAYEDGDNCTLGGQINPMQCEQSKLIHDNKMRSLETREKISSSMKEYKKQNPVSEETREKLRQKALGNIRFKGKKRTPDAIQKTAQSLYKKVYCLDLNGNVVKEFNSVTDAAKWWFNNGYDNVKSTKDICNRIKDSYKKDRNIKGLKWIYKNCVETIERVSES